MHRDTVNNRPVLLVVAAMAVVLGGCAYNTAVKRDIHSQFYEIRPGSKLILHRAIDIPPGKAHVTFGAGYYEGNCEFEVRTLGPGTVQPDTFLITRQPDVLQLICQDWDGPLLGRDISVAEMRTALGDTFSFEFVP
jgi:hypothetical protein